MAAARTDGRLSVAVVYVAGAMRSGTTILGQLIASSDDTILVGEVRPLLAEPERHEECDCGRQRSACPFWTQVYEGIDVAELAKATGRAYSLRTIPRAAAALMFRRPLPPDVLRTVAFLRAIRRAAGERVVIDTSKTPMGILFWALAGEPVHIAQCVRSVVAVARAQHRPRAEIGHAPESIAKSVGMWACYNALTLLARPFTRSHRLISFAGYGAIHDVSPNRCGETPALARARIRDRPSTTDIRTSSPETPDARAGPPSRLRRPALLSAPRRNGGTSATTAARRRSGRAGRRSPTT